MPNPTGPDLRRERRAAEVTLSAVARAMRLSRNTIHIMEGQASPDPERVTAYLAAVASLCDTSKVSPIDAA